MIHLRVVLPEDLENEQRALYDAFFSQYSEDDEIPEGALEEFFRQNASRKLKRALRQNQRYLNSLPPGVHA